MFKSRCKIYTGGKKRRETKILITWVPGQQERRLSVLSCVAGRGKGGNRV